MSRIATLVMLFEARMWLCEPARSLLSEALLSNCSIRRLMKYNLMRKKLSMHPSLDKNLLEFSYFFPHPFSHLLTWRGWDVRVKLQPATRLRSFLSSTFTGKDCTAGNWQTSLSLLQIRKYSLNKDTKVKFYPLEVFFFFLISMKRSKKQRYPRRGKCLIGGAIGGADER